MYILKANESNELIEDLILTGWHSIMVDKLSFKEQKNKLQMSFKQKIDDKHLLFACVSEQFKKIKTTNIYTYYNFILENDGNDDKDRYGVYANGVLAETPSKTQFLEHCKEGYLRL
jgi:hypothetical protein